MTRDLALTSNNSPASDFRVGAREEEKPLLHLAIAEQGKLYALEGNHARALFYYRKAMQMAIEARDPEAFFRHYLECVIESLEHLGSYDEIFEYCEQALRLYGDDLPRDPLVLRNLAHVYQRLGVVRLKSGDRDGAGEALRMALGVLAGTGQRLPLATALVRWIEMGLHVDPARIAAEQKKARYFSVRPSTVDPARAVRLPDAILPPGLGLGP